ncbi:MAG: PD40 domain-containing protein, partial [Alphaproteobacteria bacterium]|nr:PD40 domain-containing protein [Alphaproteobacteria bacterium]
MPRRSHLRRAILNANAGDVIQFACATAPCTISLNGPLPPIQTSLTIDGGSRGRIVIDGQNLYRALFADSGTIAISNLRIQNVRAKGGNGGSGGGSVSAPGGGGAGLGAGLFVSTNANVTLTAVDFATVAAVGGTGGSSVSVIGPASGGGGGLGGDGGNGQTGGNGAGGGGVLGAGSDNTSSNGGDGGLGGGGGGAGDRPANASGTGGAGYGSASAGGNGGSADSGIAYRGAGGNGGFGGGGGGAPNPSIGGAQSLGLGTAGNGGFGGGGGGADQQTDGGLPGPGGGGGGSSNLPVAGGVLMSGLRGGQGNNSRAGGGGGAAAGPAIFVYQGSITVATSTVEGATATGGAGGTATWNPALGGTAGGADASPVFNYDGNVNGATARGPVNGILVGGLQGLTVTRDGTGSGTVTASAGGLSCPGTCSTNIGTYTDVTLTAVAATGSSFGGWSGDCSGTGTTASFTSVTAALACTATFTSNPVTPTDPTTPATPLPAPLPSFVANPMPPVLDARAGPGGSGTLSLAAYFPNPAVLAFSVSAPGGVPSWLTFEPVTAIFSFTVPAAADRAGDMRATWPNTIYPPALRAARIPVTVSASAAGQTYTVTVDMSFYHPRNPGVMAAASVSLDGVAGNAPAGRSSLSFDGGQLVFESTATNLFPGSANSFTDILRYDGLSGMRDRLSQTAIPGGGVANAADGASLNPAVSADGRWAAFASDAPGITLMPSGRVRQVYRASLVYPRLPLNEGATPTPSVVSITAAGAVGNGLSDNPAISQDGRYVAFDSTATNLGEGLDGTRHVWRKDLVTGVLLHVAAGSNPTISWDGNLIAYETDGQVQLKDLTAGTLQAIGVGHAPRLSARGDRLVYANAGKIMLGGQVVADGDQPGLSADGRFVVYRSGGQVWVRDLDRGVSALVSQVAAGTPAAGESGNPAISGDGTTISFTSTVRDLVGGNLAAGQLYVAANPLPLPGRAGYWHQADAANGQGWVMERWGNRVHVGGLVYDTAGQPTWTTGLCTLQGLICRGRLSGWSGGAAFGAAGGAGPV